MTLRNTFRTSFLLLFFCFSLLGCNEKKSFTLDKDDSRFVGFYSDYLLLSGVPGENDAVVLDSAELSDLLVRHALTRESLTRKTEAYKQHPELWRAVLIQVRENMRKKSGGGQ
ncbi:MAG: hypothetical protein WCG19_03700 [Chlorobiaceae bacterium]